MDAYYVSEQPVIERANSMKVMRDIDVILGGCGLKKVTDTISVYPDRENMYTCHKINRARAVMHACKRLSGQIIFIQYPTALGDKFIFPHYIKSIAKKNKVVFILRDLPGLKFGSAFVTRVDKKVLKSGYKIISHNQIMTNYLVRKYRIPAHKITNLNIFDYLTSNVSVDQRVKSNEIVYAGDLDINSRLIEKYKRAKIDAKLNLYGPTSSESTLNSANTKYCGIFPSDLVNLKLKGSFGLVWDGVSLDDCEGTYGEYTKYNNPHKASLYIISRLPLITAKCAAISKFVEVNHIGFSVNSLKEIPEKISGITDAEYQQMITNITLVANRVSSGKYLEEIVEKIINQA